MDKDLKEAVIELAGFYGMSVGDEYIKALVTEEQTAEKALSQALNASKNNPLAPFNERKKQFKTLMAAVEEIREIENVDEKISITPNDQSVAEAIQERVFENNTDFADIVNDFGYGDQGKGLPAPGDTFYTTTDIRPYIPESLARDIEAKMGPDFEAEFDIPVHIIQAFSAQNAPPSVGTEAVALWLNSIPAVEMSRAIPMIDIRIHLPDKTKIGESKPLSLFKFLLGDTVPESADAKEMINADFHKDILAGQSSKMIPAGEFTDAERDASIVSSMEIFTSPQTMVSSKDSSSSPFRPFLSFQSFNIDVAPAGGMMAVQTAEMSFILHDKTRLKDVLGLVAPANIGKTQLEVHYGWSHPDHNNMGRPSDASINNRYAKLVNAMRSTEIYNVISADYKFNDSGEIELDVRLSLAGTSIARKGEITDGVAEEKEKALNEIFKEIRKILATLRGKKGKISKIAAPSYVTAAASLGGATMISDKDLKKLKAFIKRAKKSKDVDFKELGKNLDEVYKKKGKLAGFVKSKKQLLSELMDLLTTGPDPFLPRRQIGNVTSYAMRVNNDKQISKRYQTYASFGKLFSVFVGEAFRSRGVTEFSEIQIIFYPINESASFAHTLNLAQFPIQISDFRTIIEQKFDPVKSMTIGRFLSLVNAYYFRDVGNPVYGLNSLYGPREKKDKEQTARRKKSKAANKLEADQLNDKKLGILRNAYGGSGDDYTFRMPQVTVKYECAPGIDASGSPTEAPILRIHIMDEACGKAEQLKDIFMSFGDGHFTKKDRTREETISKEGATNGLPVRTPRHQELVTKAIANLGDLVENVDGSLYVLKTKDDGSLSFNLKEKIKSLFPTVVHGAAHTNMISADLSTISDSAMNTIMMMRQDQSNPDNDQGKDGGIPLQIMPTQLSVETYGCPLVSFGQQFFFDFNTGTTADNFYAVTGIKHKFEAGAYTTEIDLKQLDAFGTFRSAASEISKLKKELSKTEDKAKAK